MSLIPSFSNWESSPIAEEDETEDSKQLSTLRDLLDLLCNTKKSTLKLEEVPHELADKLKLPLHDFLKKHKYLVSYVQEFARVRFAIKQKISRDGFKLLFEGRFLSADLSTNFRPFLKNKPTWHITLDNEGNVLKCSKRPTSFPKSHILPKIATREKLSFGELVLGKERAQLEGCDSMEQDPQSQPEAVCCLAKWGFSDKVRVNFCVSLSNVSVPVCWINPTVSSNLQPMPKLIRLEAFTGQKNRIRFRVAHIQMPRGVKKLEGIQKEQRKQNPDGAFESNRSSGMSVHLTGLSQALKLGLLSQIKNKPGTEVLEELSSGLSRAFAFLWMQRDSLGRVRHVTYHDCHYDHPQSFEIGPGSLAPTEIGQRGPAKVEEENLKRELRLWHDWKAVFDYIWQCRGSLLACKKDVTSTLFDKLGTEKDLVGGTHRSCFLSLKNSLAKIRVFCFSTDDSSLHSIKLFFARYCEEVRELRRGVHLRTVNGTQICCLQTSEVEVENVSQFFHFGNSSSKVLVENDPDANALLHASLDWCPELGSLHHHEVQVVQDAFKGDRICREAKVRLDARGVCFVRRLAAMQVAFVSWICKRFQLDLATSPFLTLSSLSFRVVMLDFWKRAGPTAHSIEKTKPHWEDCLRKLCKGGFSYSFRDFISSGNSLDSRRKEAENTVAIAEFDLKSCYGYSLTNMAVPGCFSVGYTYSEEKKCLVRTDRHNRANSFEYLVVQSLVRAAETSYPGKIAAVWSNYSPIGILYIGKYPVDLAIVVEGKSLLLIQCDGQVIFESLFVLFFFLALSIQNYNFKHINLSFFSLPTGVVLVNVPLCPAMPAEHPKRRC